MIIKSHIRGGFRSAAEYLKEQGKNEKTRLVEISDPEAKDLDEAFHNMWVVASSTLATKPLHHISINPMKGERLTDTQVLKIVERCEDKYGYKQFHHQRVIVEHVKDGRQHFHVIWNRVSLYSGITVWPGEHWKKSKQICREMEVELGLKRPTPKRTIKVRAHVRRIRTHKSIGHYDKLNRTKPPSYGRSLIVSATKKNHHVHKHQAEAITPSPIRPPTTTKGWPEAAILDWEQWGKKNPRRFFSLWPELSR